MEKKVTALMKATELLAKSEQSSNLLRQKLLARKFDENEVDVAIEKLEKLKYLDDDELCTRQFENLYSAKKLSVRQICVKLVQKGFDLEFVKNLIPNDVDEHELKVALNILEKKYRRQNFGDEKENYKFKTKLWNYLATKGFESKIISSAIEDFLND